MSRLTDKAKALLKELDQEAINWNAVIASSEEEFLNYKTQFENDAFSHFVVIKTYE